jgi:uncharacterized protein YcnI
VRAALLAGALVALALPTAALGHVTVLPPYLAYGETTTLVFSAPNERAPHAVVRLTVTVPQGIDLRPIVAPAGWRLQVAGPRATWRDGRTGPGQVGVFRLLASTRLEPETVSIRAVQRYDDGGTVPWTIPLTILPAANPPKQHLWPALIAGVVGVVAIGGGLTWLRLRRRV